MKQEDNPYEGLRRMALETTPEQLGLSLSAARTIVYGIVMDWQLKNGTATITSFCNGDAGIYFSSGTGIIGEGTHEDVKITAMAFVEKAQFLLEKTEKTELTPLPEDDIIIFYFLTNNGVFKGHDKVENFDSQSSVWLGLFLHGTEVINELRKTQGVVD